MTVCIVTDSFPPDLGGIATFYGNLSGLLTDAGHQVVVIKADQDAGESEADEIITSGQLIKVILRRSYKEKYGHFKRYFRPGGLNAPSWISAGLSIREWLLENSRNYNIDIIEVCDYGGMAAFLCHHDLPPVTITGHGSLTQYSKINHTKNDDHYKVIIELERLSIKHAALVFSFSPVNQIDLENTFYRSIDFATAPWLSDQLNAVQINTSGLPLVVAGLQLIKGAELMTKAMKEIISKLSLNVEWIGMDFHTAPGGVSTAEYLGLHYPLIWNKCLLWQNGLKRQETIQKIAQARFIVIPSIFETFSYVALEAATLGKAMIITESTGAAYLFTHGINAWIVPPDKLKLSEAILYLQNNPELCATLGNNARKMVGRNFIKEKIVEERMLLYNQAIGLHIKQNNGLPDLSFLNKYLTVNRKTYYRLRQLAKKMIKGYSTERK